MNIEERIEKDLDLFDENYDSLEDCEAKKMARRYYDDAKYYLERKEYVSAFGCIAYAHGLIDAIRLYHI